MCQISSLQGSGDSPELPGGAHYSVVLFDESVRFPVSEQSLVVTPLLMDVATAVERHAPNLDLSFEDCALETICVDPKVQPMVLVVKARDDSPSFIYFLVTLFEPVPSRFLFVVNLHA